MTTAARRLRIVAAAIFLTLAAFVPATAAGSHNWMTQKSGVAATLNDVSCASVIDCYAVGQSGVIITTHNGGATWSKIQNPFSGTGQGLSSIRCGSAGHCAVVIRPNLVMTTANAGKIWQIHIIKFPSTISQVNRVACPAANTCYITLAPSGNPFSWFSHSGAMYKTTNGGLTWSHLPIPTSVPCPGDCGHPFVGWNPNWVSCVSATICRAGGVDFLGSHEGYSSGVISTNDGGANWTLVHSSIDAAVASCGTAKVCVGTRYQPTTPNYGPDFLRTWDGGKTWIDKPAIKVLNDVACNGPSFCELVGPNGALVMASGGNQYKQKSPTTATLNAVACPAGNTCYAVGANGTVVAKK